MGLLPKFIDNAAGPPAQAVGNTLSNLWELGIGSHVTLWVKKQEARQQQNLEDYIKKVEEKTQEIPEEFIREPQLHIVGPAIEASKYYIESNELREMFANLIASSIDNRLVDETHPSFVEIVKQLSPMDATVLKNFKNISQTAISEVRIIATDQSYVTFQEHVMDFTEKSYYKIQASSLSNLQRLGLLEISYDSNMSNDSYYEYMKQHPVFVKANEELIQVQKSDSRFTTVDFQKGLCKKTPLCKDFIKVCL